MGGIAGFVGSGDRAVLSAMSRAIAHRGPDSEGIYQDPAKPVFLLHRRLSIVDPVGGMQPMWNEDKSIGVTFDGEIYNHVKLREDLIARGHVFSSDHSDTEVLVHGYEQWGEDLPKYLDGIFSFAIYDRYKGRIFLARDPFGKKPMYYTNTRHVFCFASELDALLAHPDTPRKVNDASVQQFFANGYIPSPQTMYKSVHKLPAGHGALYDIASQKLQVQMYWSYRVAGDTKISFRDAKDWLRELLDRAVVKRLMSDVPGGVFLNGDMDSTAVLAMAAKYMPAKDIQTFSVSFSEKDSHYSDMVAAHYGTDHHREILSSDTARDAAFDILGMLDEPLGDPSVIATSMMARLAQKHVKIALGGDGGDDLFAGHDPFRALGPAQLYHRFFPAFVKDGFEKTMSLMPMPEGSAPFLTKLKSFMFGARHDPFLWNPTWAAPADRDDFQGLFGEKMVLGDMYAAQIEHWNACSSTNFVDRSIEYYARFPMQDQTLAMIDRGSMRQSLEVRTPFLDRDLAAFAAGLPADMKMRFGVTKYILRRALDGVVPRKILYRSKKSSALPVSSWLRQWDRDAVLGNIGALNINTQYVRKLLDEHVSGKRDHGKLLWCVMAMGQYAKRLA